MDSETIQSEETAAQPTATRTSRLRGGFGAGVGAAIFMLLVMGLLRFVSNTASIPELMEDGLIQLTGGEINSFFINTFGTGGKALLLVIILEGTLLLGGLLGLLYTVLWTGRGEALRWRWLSALLYGLGIGLLLNSLFLPAFGHGLFGSQVLQVTAPQDIAQTLYGTTLAPWGIPAWIHMFLLGFMFALALVRLLPWHEREAKVKETYGAQSEERRGFLKATGGVLLALFGGAAMWGIFARALQAPESAGVVEGGQVPTGSEANPEIFDTSRTDDGEVRPTPEPAEEGFEDVKALLVPEITPTDTFYITTKNFVDPSLVAAQWSLTFKGLVDNPFTIGYDEIKALPSELRTHTLACISNPVGGSLIGNGRWRGVSFADLLKRAKPQQGAVDIVVKGADGYTDSFTVDAGLNNNGLLAYEMNGAPLNQKHGYPLRLLIPGIFGMKNCKWITEVELVNNDHKGYWQRQGWSDPAPYLTMSRIDFPDKSGIEAKPLYIGGIAFAGERGIQRVEVSVDGGKTWKDAQVRPPLGDHTWVLWQFPWDPEPGEYTIQSRATDGNGDVQTADEQGTFPDGATGYHTRRVRVTAPSGQRTDDRGQRADWGRRSNGAEMVVPVMDKRAKGY
jgi:DMSO/TMAO reductase YedYZ molybdopterin-dependent catalytic subunit